MENKKVYLSAIAYSFIIGLSFLFTKLVVTSTSPIKLLAHRFLISFITIQLFITFKKIKISFNKKEILEILPVSLFYPILFFVFQAYGLKYISSSESGVLFAVTPVITLILARIFIKEEVNFIQTFGVILSVSGVLYIFFMKGVSFQSNSTFGIFLTLVSVLTSAVFSVLVRKIVQKYNFLHVTYVILLIGAVTFNFIYIVNNYRNLSFTAYFNNFMDIKYLSSMVALGVLASVISSLISAYALSKIPAAQFSVFSNFATLISVIAGVLILKEKFYFYHLFGTVLIIIGVILTNFGNVIIKKLSYSKN